MTARKWHSGPPPSIGWWPASLFKSEYALRWWNGQYWSALAYPGYSIEAVIQSANEKANIGTLAIFWTDRPKSWPKRSRI